MTPERRAEAAALLAKGLTAEEEIFRKASAEGMGYMKEEALPWPGSIVRIADDSRSHFTSLKELS